MLDKTATPEHARDVAHGIIVGLKEQLRHPTVDDLSGIRSLFVYGSFLRGDWLDSNSDLDIGVLFSSAVILPIPYRRRRRATK